MNSIISATYQVHINVANERDLVIFKEKLNELLRIYSIGKVLSSDVSLSSLKDYKINYSPDIKALDRLNLNLSKIGEIYKFKFYGLSYKGIIVSKNGMIDNWLFFDEKNIKTLYNLCMYETIVDSSKEEKENQLFVSNIEELVNLLKDKFVSGWSVNGKYKFCLKVCDSDGIISERRFENLDDKENSFIMDIEFLTDKCNIKILSTVISVLEYMNNNNIEQYMRLEDFLFISNKGEEIL